MPLQADLGHVRRIDLRPGQESADHFFLQVHMPNGDRVSLLTRREALRALWAYLTQILYPQAAGMTMRMETVANHNTLSLSQKIGAYVDAVDPSLVIIGVFTRDGYWNMRLGWEATEDLWTSLHDHLNGE